MPERRPITRDNLLSALASMQARKSTRKNAAWYVAMIKDHKVDFQLTPEDEKAIARTRYLGKKGVDDLVAAVRNVAPPPPKPLRLLLTPGSHATPKLPPCMGDYQANKYEVPTGTMAVFFGDSVAFTKGTKITIVSIDGEDVLSFRRVTGQMYLTGIIRDLPGNDVITIADNLVTVISESKYEVLNPDSQNLVILNPQGKKILSVRYVNDSAMVVSGVFWGKKSGPLIVNDGSAITFGHTTYSENCLENHEGPLFRLKSWHFQS